MSIQASDKARQVEVTEKDLPLHCPFKRLIINPIPMMATFKAISKRSNFYFRISAFCPAPAMFLKSAQIVTGLKK